MLNPALIYWRFTWLRDDRLREAESARLAALARRMTHPRRKQELEPCTAS